MKNFWIALFVILSSTTAFSQVDSAKLYREAKALFAEEKAEEGLVKLNQIITAYPDAKDALYARGYTYLNEKKFDLAKLDLFKAAPLYEHPEEILYGTGLIIIQQFPIEDIENAAPYFDEAIRIAPTVCEPVLFKGLMNYYKEKFTDAVTNFRKGITMCEDKANEVVLYYANALYKSGDKTGARAELDKFLAKNPESPDAILLRSDWNSEDKNYDKALADLNALIEKVPEDGRLYSKRAKVYKEQGKNDLACTDVVTAQRFGDETALQTFGKDICMSKTPSVSVKSGMTLRYQVNYYGDYYFFDVKVNTVSSSEVSFKWSMSNNSFMKGNVTIAAKALESAYQMMNYFTPGDTTLTEQSTIWLSRKAYNAIAAKKSITLDNGLGDTLLDKISESEFTLISNNKNYLTIPCIVAENADQSESIIVQKDANMPIILGMNLGWTIELVEVF